MTSKELEALRRYEMGEQPNVSTSIDDDTILMGYGQLDYADFEFPLPIEKIIEIHGTTSWSQKFKNMGLKRYISINEEEKEECILGWLTEAQVTKIRKDNPDFTIKEIL